MTTLRSGIPAGKTRVIGIDLFSHEDYLVKDCDTPDEAFIIASENNKKRTGSMDDVYYVYDDKGNFMVRGDEAVSELSVSP